MLPAIVSVARSHLADLSRIQQWITTWSWVFRKSVWGGIRFGCIPEADSARYTLPIQLQGTLHITQTSIMDICRFDAYFKFSQRAPLTHHMFQF